MIENHFETISSDRTNWTEEHVEERKKTRARRRPRRRALARAAAPRARAAPAASTPRARRTAARRRGAPPAAGPVCPEVPAVLQPVPRNKSPEPSQIKPDRVNKISSAKIEEQKGNAVESNIKATQVVPFLKGYNVDRIVWRSLFDWKLNNLLNI